MYICVRIFTLLPFPLMMCALALLSRLLIYFLYLSFYVCLYVFMYVYDHRMYTYTYIFIPRRRTSMYS